jgi:hypothetical protein
MALQSLFSPGQVEESREGMSQATKGQISEAHRLRSRRSILKEQEFRTAIKKVHAGEAVTERRLTEADAYAARYVKWVIREGQEQLRPQLNDAMRDLAIQRELVKACQAQRASLGAEIEKLSPGPEEGATRQHHQEQGRALVNKRLELDRQADGLLKGLREVLAARSQVTQEMAEPIAALDLTISDDGLDTRRFEKLLDSLPNELLPQSERWHGWFLGEQKDAKAYVVRVEHLLVPESLIDNGLYHFGELIYLSEEQARDLLCDDYYAGKHENLWRCQRAKVMTVEAYEAAAKTAREKGLSVEEVCFWMDAERDIENRAWFRRNGARKTMHKRPASAEDDITFESTTKVRIKQQGQIIEVPNDDRALTLVSDSSGSPP